VLHTVRAFPYPSNGAIWSMVEIVHMISPHIIAKALVWVLPEQWFTLGAT